MKIVTWVKHLFYLLYSCFYCRLHLEFYYFVLCLQGSWYKITFYSISYYALQWFGGTIKIGFCEHFLQNVACKFIVRRRMELPITCLWLSLPYTNVATTPALLGCHMTQLWDGLPLQMCRKWVLGVEWPSCLYSWLERCVLGDECWVSSSVLMWQLLDALVFFFAEGVGPGMPILRTQAKI